ncbi:MAG: response regulator [Verrucomicrobia bacterium]|nr:response regulator [Cytophagales bacterium]
MTKKIKRVLIIDDEEDTCQLIKAYLERSQIEVAYANEFRRGIEKIEDFEPELIFLDNYLPDATSVCELPQLKKRFPDITIVMISATAHLQEKALTAGADGFIEKPLSFKAVKAFL